MDAEEGRWEQRLHTQVGAGPSEVLEPSPPGSFSGPQASRHHQHQLAVRVISVRPFLLPSRLGSLASVPMIGSRVGADGEMGGEGNP